MNNPVSKMLVTAIKWFVIGYAVGAILYAVLLMPQKAHADQFAADPIMDGATVITARAVCGYGTFSFGDLAEQILIASQQTGITNTESIRQLMISISAQQITAILQQGTANVFCQKVRVFKIMKGME